MKTFIRGSIAGVALLASAALAGCGGSAATIHVIMKDVGFSPDAITATVGDTVVFDNMDFIAHTATAKDGATFDLTLEEGKNASVKLTQAGVIHYICRFHPNMTGTITVAAR
jgi:plastocyanin